MKFSASLLDSHLQTLTIADNLEGTAPPNLPSLIVAFSGGADSTALLHALSHLRNAGKLSGFSNLQAWHVNHNLQSESKAWAKQCERFCQQHRIEFQCFNVDATPQHSESPEAAARRTRYTAFQDAMELGDWLCAAHHQDDQAETLLLQLLRGAGIRGLAAMPEITLFGAGKLVRPLLPFSRESLRDYVKSAELNWIEDPTNQQTCANRNYLRHEILPHLQQRWPAANRTISRSAHHCAEASNWIEQQTAHDFIAEQLDLHKPLPIAFLQESSSQKTNQTVANQRLRFWLEQNGADLPDTHHLQQIFSEVIGAKTDATPELHWKNRAGKPVIVRRFQQKLYLQIGEPEPLQWQCEILDTRLDQQRVEAAGITVRKRQGGEKCQPAGKLHHRTLKNLLREAEIPPWERREVLLIFAGETLVQVVGKNFSWVCESPFLKPV